MMVTDSRHDDDADLVARYRKSAKRSATNLARAQADVLEGRAPDVADADDLDVAMVDNPLDHGARPRKQPAIVSLRNDPVGRMHKRKQISDAQLRGARRWQELWEASEIGGARAIDYGREPVDGGRVHDAFSTGRLSAADVLASISKALGHDGAVLVRRVLAEKCELAQVGAMLGKTKRHDLEYLGQRFRECLDTIARHFGYGEEARGRTSAPMRHEGERPTMHEWNYVPDDATS